MTDHILIVEDDEMVQSFLRLQLEKEGYAVTAVGTGGEIEGVLNRERVDMVLLDLGLPDGDGLERAQEIRSKWHLPIIVATARKGADDRLTALGLGVDDYLTKPYDPRELSLRIRNILNRTEGVVAAGAAGAADIGRGRPESLPRRSTHEHPSVRADGRKPVPPVEQPSQPAPASLDLASAVRPHQRMSDHQEETGGKAQVQGLERLKSSRIGGRFTDHAES